MKSVKKTDEYYFQLAATQAQKSLCLRRRCGSVIIKDESVIGRGYNAPPLDDVKQRRCSELVDKLKKYPTDKTCCIHAEQRAMHDAITTNSSRLPGAKLYFASIDDANDLQNSGDPYCTICSKMALDTGIAYFYLYTKDGSKRYDTKTYNDMSFASA